MTAVYLPSQSGKVNPQVKYPAGGVFAGPEIAFTIVRSDQTPLTKTFEAGPNGVPTKSRDAGMSAGVARRVVLRGTAAAMMRQYASAGSPYGTSPAGMAQWLALGVEVGARQKGQRTARAR
jgi:hypothetical protein